jgi:hypothetical protein
MHDVVGLADAVGAVDGLGFSGRVPPRVEQEAVVGFDEVQSESADLEAYQENRCGPILEPLDYLGTVAGSPIEVAVVDSLDVEAIALPAQLGSASKDFRHVGGGGGGAGGARWAGIVEVPATATTSAATCLQFACIGQLYSPTLTVQVSSASLVSSTVVV